MSVLTVEERLRFEERVHAMACAMVESDGDAAGDSNKPTIIAQQAIKVVQAIDLALAKLRADA